MRTLMAYTEEIDDIESAIASIKTQLDSQGVLAANTVGLICCHSEFVNSGVTAALGAALPFDVTGIITMNQACEAARGQLLLTLAVLTGDDVDFVVGMTGDINIDARGAIETTYRELSAQKQEAPVMALIMAPFSFINLGDDYANILSAVSDGLPCFGTMAIDDSDDLQNCYMIFNEEACVDKLSMVLIYANVKPRFVLATISEDRILPKPALVTKSDRAILQAVNGKPVREFFENLGLGEASEERYAMSSFPFMLDYNDGTPPVSKVFVDTTPDGAAVCAGRVPEGATIYVGMFNKEDVLKTTGHAIDEALSDIEGKSFMLMYSCVSRSMSLANESMAEVDLVREKIGGRLPFMMGYSGGELCPTRVSNSVAINRFHNNTFIACIL